MKGFVEPKTLAAVLTRARGPSCSRNYSAGIGRGSGGLRNTEDSLFDGSYGHGAPLYPPPAGRGAPLNAGFSGRGGFLNPPSGAGRGLGNANAGINNGPLLPIMSHGRGSVSQRYTETPVSDSKPPAGPSGFTGFGRGKPVDKDDPPEDIFASERKGLLSAWSKWDEKVKKADSKENASPAELRLLADDDLQVPAVPQQPGQTPQTEGWQAPAPFQATPFQQPPPPGSPGRQDPVGGLAFQATPFQQPLPPGSPGRQAPVGGVGFQATPFQQPPPPGSPGWQAPTGGPPFQAMPLQQPPPPGSPGWQAPTGGLPFQATIFQQPPPLGSPGWQAPIGGAPFQDTPFQQPLSPGSRGQQAPTRGPPFVAAPFQQPPPGWQAPTNGARFQANPFQQPPPPGCWQASEGGLAFQANPFQQPPPPRSHGQQAQAGDLPFSATPSQQSSPPRSPGWQPVQEPQYDVRVPSQPFAGYAPPSTGWQQPGGMGEHYNSFSPMQPQQDDGAMPYAETSYSSIWEPGQPAWAPSTPEIGQQTYAQDPMGDWSSDPMQGTVPAYDSSQRFLGSDQGHYEYSAGIRQPLNVAPHTPEVKYDWGEPTPEELEEKFNSEAPALANTGSDYDRRIEECYKQGKLEDIDSIFNEMRASQVRASAKTYDTLMQSYLQLKKMDKVSEVYQEMSGVLFSDTKTRNAESKETSSATERKTSVILQVEDVASAELSSSGHDAQHRTKFEEDRIAEKDVPSSSFNTGAQGFTPSVAVGAGRGKKVGSFFDFDFSGGLGSSDSTGYGRETLKSGQGTNLEMTDDYSQTFTPVLQPGWHDFAPQGISIGRGAGRGRPQSPQGHVSGTGSSMSFISEQFDSGAGRGGRNFSYEERMQAALQQAPPLYSRDRPALEPEYDYPQEPSQPALSEEEAAERAMKILNARRYERFEKWAKQFDDGEVVVKRSPAERALSKLREKSKPKRPVEVEKEVKLSEEDAKKEAEMLKALEQNKALQELYNTFDSFMKCYGEMALEPEHELGDFTNPDIDEKPFPSLEEYLEKAKPNVMKTGLIRSEKEWRKMVKEALKNAAYYEEFVERYSGPGRYTAKQENEDLEEIASTLPTDVGRGVKSFVQRSLTTLKSNPGFNLDEKQWMLATMVDDFSEYAVTK